MDKQLFSEIVRSELSETVKLNLVPFEDWYKYIDYWITSKISNKVLDSINSNYLKEIIVNSNNSFILNNVIYTFDIVFSRGTLRVEVRQLFGTDSKERIVSTYRHLETLTKFL